MSIYLWYHSHISSISPMEPRNASPERKVATSSMAGIQKALDDGAVPSHISNVCPPSTRAYLLEVGRLECDEGFRGTRGKLLLESNEGHLLSISVEKCQCTVC